MKPWFLPPDHFGIVDQYCWYLVLVQEEAEALKNAAPDDKWIAECGLDAASLLLDCFCDKHGIDADTFSPETFCEFVQPVQLKLWD